MRVMLDTNVLISALLFPSKQMDVLFEKIVANHTLVLSSYVINEVHMVVERKFPNKIQVIDRLLSNMSYELVYTPKIISEIIAEIRDPKDYPILYTAIKEEIDVLITGDKDFYDLKIDRPEIISPGGFIEKY
ncbi:MAG: putative toxin-antitoxin system toxin component, PIN family [Anaerovoracaceae bacterium]